MHRGYPPSNHYYSSQSKGKDYDRERDGGKDYSDDRYRDRSRNDHYSSHSYDSKYYGNQPREMDRDSDYWKRNSDKERERYYSESEREREIRNGGSKDYDKRYSERSRFENGGREKSRKHEHDKYGEKSKSPERHSSNISSPSTHSKSRETSPSKERKNGFSKESNGSRSPSRQRSTGSDAYDPALDAMEDNGNDEFGSKSENSSLEGLSLPPPSPDNLVRFN